MDGARRGIRRLRERALGDILAVSWLVAIGVGFLGPALSHGSALGPYDVLHLLGLTGQTHPHVHNAIGSDQIQEFIPWQVLSWRQVHAGHLPLWDPSSLLGMPYGLNFESAPFGLTTAIGYAFPLALAHTATVAARLVLAGTGAYVACRVMRLGPLAAVTGATVFELSGAFTIWMGTYESGVYCFMGWVLAASLLVLRGRRRAVPGVLLAVALAFTFAAGEPQVDALVVAFLAVFVAVVAWVGARRGAVAPAGGTGTAGPGGTGAGGPGGTPPRVGRVALDHLLALVAAGGLVAPLYLPAGQLLLRAARTSGPYVSALRPHELTHLLFASYNGVPTAPASYIGPDDAYVSMVYVGAIGLVLAWCALAWWRRRAEVVALTVLAAGLLVALFFPPVVTVLRHLPLVKVFRLDLATPLLDLALALLAAFGAAALLGGGLHARQSGRARHAAVHASRAPHSPPWARWRGVWRADRLFATGTALCALALAALGVRLATAGNSLSAAQAQVRASSFLWPAISVAACAVVAAALLLSERRSPAAPTTGPAGDTSRGPAGGGGRLGAGQVRTWALLFLLAVETAFLFVSGAWTPSSSSHPLATPRPVAALAHATHGRLTAIGACVENAFPDLGVMPDANALYGISELAYYDPILPNAYYAAYGAVAGTTRKPLVPHVFCPQVTSVAVARFFGVSYVLEPPGAPGPPGTRALGQVGGEGLDAVPASGRATLVPLARARGRTAVAVASGPGQHVARAQEPSPSTWRVTVAPTRPSLLVLRVTAAPGWHATIDGAPLPLRPYGGVLMAADVPAGHHTVVLSYWPPLMSVGLVVFAATAAALLGVLAAAGWARRRAHAGARGGAPQAGPPHAPPHGPSHAPRHARASSGHTSNSL